MRIYTCTPLVFSGGADFFARDSGLLCRGFQIIGIESKAVMPGERMPDDDADLIRTEFKNLESPDWWRCRNLDGVVLYAWGSPKFRKVAAAIHSAGIFLVLNQDNGGLVSPLVGFRDWLREQWILAGQGRDAPAYQRFLKLTLRGLSAGVLVTDPLRACHLKNGDVIACVSPKAAQHYRKLCRIYGGRALADRVYVLPHAVESRFFHDDKIKRRQVACVGRWQDEIQKRPWLLMDVVGALVDADDEVIVVVAGTKTPEMELWHQTLSRQQQGRVKLLGRVGRVELAEILRESQVFYSPSAFESFGIAAAEALCSGCSVVAGTSVSMASFDWFVSENSGSLAKTSDSQKHVRSLLDELDSWKHGRRDPAKISSIWSSRLHAEKVAALVLGLGEGKMVRF